MKAMRELHWRISDSGMEPRRRGLGKAKGRPKLGYSYISVLPEAGPASVCAGVKLIAKLFTELIFRSLEARCPGKDVSSMP